MKTLQKCIVGEEQFVKAREWLDKGNQIDDPGEILKDNADEVSYLLSQPVIDMRGNGHNTNRNIRDFRAAADSLTKLKELFMVIYQVRCNLAHGEKSPNRDRDIQLCLSAAPLVFSVVSQIVNEDR